jgi:CPA1 family monovalent cation:H+ antiporter
MGILRRVTGSSISCVHVPDTAAEPQADRCQECGSSLNLRLCATCGHVGCCESQLGHARAHALGNSHPVIYEMPAPKGFIWCYEERAYIG